MGLVGKVGIIGLGAMGSGMFSQLQKLAGPVGVFDVSSQAMERAQGQGGLPAASAAALAAQSDYLVISIPGRAMETLFYGIEGILRAVKAGAVVIDTSSTGPRLTERLAKDLRERGVHLLDAPVSGGPGGAAAGKLALMVGGDADAYARAEPLLRALGTPVYVGPSGAGQLTKLINNMIVGVQFAAVAEAFALAARLGLDAGRVFEAIKGGAAQSWVLDVGGAAMLRRDFSPGGTIDLHVRDLANALDVAREAGCSVPVTAVTHELYVAAAAAGLGGEAQQALVKLWERHLGIQIVDGTHINGDLGRGNR